MRIIKDRLIEECIYELCTYACCVLPSDVISALEAAKCNELPGSAAYSTLSDIIENAELAKQSMRPCCQDTGMTVVFADIGEEVFIEGSLNRAINEGVRKAYIEECFRKSVLDPITRKNTMDNTPAIIHIRFVEGDNLKLTVAPKGFGSENMSKLYMLRPADGIDSIINAVVNTVISAGACSCPPVIVGVGIGGTSEIACETAKRQLLRKIGSKADTPELRFIEYEATRRINASGIGAMGLGGNITALAVHAGSYKTHIAGLPVAVNMQCHAARHAERIL